MLILPVRTDFTRDIAGKYVSRGLRLLLRHCTTLLLLPLLAFSLVALVSSVRSGQVQRLWEIACATDLQFNLVTFLACCLLLVAVALTYVFTLKKPVYLIDYFVYQPPASLKIPMDKFMSRSAECQKFTKESLEFQRKILLNSGLGDETYLPTAVQSSPPTISMKAARQEAEMVMFECVEQALRKAKLTPKQVDILIVNCSLFNPTPSLSAMIINHFKFKSNIVSYNLSGMGCSAGVISISLARELLQVYANSTALVVSTENITQNWYFGNQRSMLIPNCLFRVGGAAIVLSNKLKDSWRAKYELQHVVRTHMGASDSSYGCVFQQEDDNGEVGVLLSKQLMAIAGQSLKANITTLAPLVLPVSEMVIFVAVLFARKVLRMQVKPYVPDFKTAFEHFCIHTGGRGVIDEIQKQLQLTEPLVQPSKATLYRYGNTSSSSIWYVLANIETKRGVARGDRVWQIAFGSGFKCNSAVWRARRTVTTQHHAWLPEDAGASEQLA